MINIEAKGINELFLIEVFRNFDFLRHLGYQTEYVDIYSREPGVIYKASRLKRKISIIMAEPDLIEIVIHNFSFSFKKNTFNVNQLIMTKFPQVAIPGILNEKNLGETLSKYSKFIQENLSSIIEGKEWKGEYTSVFQKG